MKKIETLFIRDEKNPKFVAREPNPNTAWVLAGEGVATRKWDGTCCMFKDGQLFKRYDGSKSKHLPGDFIPADGAESHWLGWRPVGEGPEDRWHKEALANCGPQYDGTYELVGPHVNGNPDGIAMHSFKRHGDVSYENVPRDFDGMKAWLSENDMEGLVFHHADGRMAKIKSKDFGIKRKVAA